MSSLAGSSHKNSMYNPLVWIEISALTDQRLTRRSAVSSQQTVECMFPGVWTPQEAIMTSIF